MNNFSDFHTVKDLKFDIPKTSRWFKTSFENQKL